MKKHIKRVFNIDVIEDLFFMEIGEGGLSLHNNNKTIGMNRINSITGEPEKYSISVDRYFDKIKEHLKENS
jgi:hypothetical protein